LTGRPHIVDFRDLWTLNHTYHHNGFSEGIKKYDAALERYVLTRATGIVTASPGFTDQMRNHLDGSLKDKLMTITNGFDYEAVNHQYEEWLLPDEKVLRFVYAGSLYSDFNPVFLLEAFAAWIKERNIEKYTVKMDFYGNTEYDYTAWLAQLGLDNIVKFHGFKPRNYVLSQERIADVLLLILGFHQESRNVIPAKFFEYLASGCPILALVPDGVIAQQVGRYKAGYCLCYPDQDKLIDIFEELYQQWSNNRTKTRRFRYIEDIDRERLVNRVAELLNKVTAG
jgi:glycosyltransferase involved in cell wall biosynthesis